MQYDTLIIYDWLSFTAKHHGPESLVLLRGMDITQFTSGKGARVYFESLRFEGVNIFYGGREEVWCEMSGQGCRTFESFGHSAWDSIFEEILSDEQYHITRLDVAFDDHIGLLDLERMYKDVDAGNFVSRMKSWDIRKSNKGITIYHGSEQSDIRFRIYDKAAERDRKEEGHWVRFEIQMRDDNAKRFLSFMILESIGEVFAKTINNYLRYVEPSETDSNKRRWPTADYWYNFISTAEKLSLYESPGTEYNFSKLERFAVTQAGAAAAAYSEIVGADTYLEMCRERLRSNANPKYTELINKYCQREVSYG